ncbi:hypothetical protein QNA23_11045 [Rhodococcus erythropolis]|uniref:hypothetical protein n=1 Tax=Rhodococcus erythropolis TaxID=1833 RepID=UPI0024BAB179|nr:hypothetical protein [Rhodococcus erythropolis]MDJ0404019.1 hypothetical protein [Rhodococcus erythropolis]
MLSSLRSAATAFGTRARNVTRAVTTGGGGLRDRARRGFAAARGGGDGASAYPNS